MRRPPTLLLGLHDRVHEDQESGRDGHGSGEVVGLVRARVLRLGHEAPGGDEDGDADGHVDEEDPGPGEQVGKDSAEQEADGSATDRDRSPDAHRLRAVRSFREGDGDDRERGRRDQRGAKPLQAAEDDEHLGRLREPVEQGRHREDDETHEEHALSPEQVARAAAEEQEAAEGQRICIDDPLQVGVRDLQVLLNRRQRDVHDGRVEHDHELRHADEHEHEPRVDVERAPGLGFDPRDSLLGHDPSP